MSPRPSAVRAALVALLALQLTTTVVVLHPALLPFDLPNPTLWVYATAVFWLPALGALARTGLSGRTTAVVVLAATAALQVAALTQPPQTSNDDLRYIWDAKVQLHGIDPYHYAPDDPALARLHEPLLFDPAGTAGCTEPVGCARLNRPTAHTIYPPVGQVAFVVVRLLSGGGHGGELAFQVAGALGVLLLTGLLLLWGGPDGRPAWWAATFGWCPVVASEIANNAHIDWLSALLVVVGLQAYRRHRPAWAGALVGAAIATKLYPVLVLPALLRRHPVRVAVAAAAVVVAGYVPHLIAVGHEVIGYLPGYLDEEGYGSGTRLLLVGRVVPHPFDTVAGALLVAVLGWLCLRTADPERPELAAVWFTGAGFLVVTPGNGWYAVLLLGLVAMSGRWHWLPVVFAPGAVYLYGPLFVDQQRADSVMYLAAALAALGWWAAGRRAEPASGPTRSS